VREGEGGGKKLTLKRLEIRQVEQRFHEVVDAVFVEVGEERFGYGSILLRSSSEGLFFTTTTTTNRQRKSDQFL